MEVTDRIVPTVLEVLGDHVRLSRVHREWTVAELAERAGVSEATVRAVEKGSPSTRIGNALAVAVACGVPLWAADNEHELRRMAERGRQEVALLPARVYPPDRDRPEDFDF